MAKTPKIAGAPEFGKYIAPEESVGKRLEGKRILLTGTTKGVGKVAQELLCAHGAFVCGSGRTKGVAAAHAEELKAKGYKAAGFDVDLSDYEAVKKWVAECAELMGGIDVVINNASHPGMAPFGEMTPDIWEYGIKNELDLIYNVCNCAWPYLQESGKNGGASIIITSSTVGLQGSNSPQACHAAAKGACLALARQLAAEGGPFGIRCNSITPGLVWTEAMANIPKEMATGLIASQTTQQAVDPIDIAYGYLFLSSDEARQITAANLPIDGGASGAVTGGMQGEIEQ
jgi:NAD(P)-dependent dehydrogenase (short-subunit alcohol dehydrogenase family)